MKINEDVAIAFYDDGGLQIKQEDEYTDSVNKVFLEKETVEKIIKEYKNHKEEKQMRLIKQIRDEVKSYENLIEGNVKDLLEKLENGEKIVAENTHSSVNRREVLYIRNGNIVTDQSSGVGTVYGKATVDTLRFAVDEINGYVKTTAKEIIELAISRVLDEHEELTKKEIKELIGINEEYENIFQMAFANALARGAVKLDKKSDKWYDPRPKVMM